MVGNDWLLTLPAGSAALYVAAAFLLKRAMQEGAGQARVNLAANVAIMVVCLPIGCFAESVDWGMVWMPLAAGGLFFLGQIFTFQALRHGDVSVATPLLGMKVLFVAVASAAVFGESLALKWWVGAAASSFGVILVTGASWRTLAPRLLRADAAMSLAAAATFALTDTCVRHWAPRFGVAGFIPLMFGAVGVLAILVFAPTGGREVWRIPGSARGWLLGGSLLLGLQALGMALAISFYGNATAVNIVYSSRAVGSVVLAWGLGRYFASPEAGSGPGVMRKRLAGSILLFGAVVLVLI